LTLTSITKGSRARHALTGDLRSVAIVWSDKLGRLKMVS